MSTFKYGKRGLARSTAALLFALLASQLTPQPALCAEQQDAALLDLQLEDLLNVQITSASKKPEALNTVASAVFVITGEDIRRSGATNVPDVLRMAPGISVARIDSNKWAVTSRGFNGRYANKLLVMVDGRTVYSPTYSGVYWDAQDLPLDDIERIEVIRGPGGSVWGANAVNGVINIISKHAADTQGGLAVIGGGNYEKGFGSLRVGGKLGEQAYGRFYIKTNHRGDSLKPDGSDSYDSWRTTRTGTRLDLNLSNLDQLTLMADYQDSDLNGEIVYPVLTAPYEAVSRDNNGYTNWSASAKWDHVVSNDSEWSLQLSYDGIDRADFLLDEHRNTLDLDFTHRFKPMARQELVWGLGYRDMADKMLPGPITDIHPKKRDNRLYSAFVQDQLSIRDDLQLTLGVKWEHNEYTDDEFQPSAKFSWRPSDDNQLWISVAKAVRTPAIAETDLDLRAVLIPPACTSPPTPYCPPGASLPILSGSVASDKLDSERLVAYELGWRSLLLPTLSIDATAFYNDYSELRSFAYGDAQLVSTPVPHLFLPAMFINAASGHNQGLELAANWVPAGPLSFKLAYTYTDTDIDWPHSFDMLQNTPAPRHQGSLQTHYQMTPTLEANLWLRYVDTTKVIRIYTPEEISPYTSADLNIMWKVTPSVELQLVGQNLFDNSHPEYIQELLVLPTEVRRSVYGKVMVRF